MIPLKPDRLTWYIVLYILFFIAQLIYGSWHVLGPLTFRHIMTFVMFFVCLRERAFKRDRFIPLFYVFVFFFVIIGLTGGYAGDTMTKFIAYYFVSIVAYFATLLFVEKYEGTYYLIITLLILGICNSVVTLGNMFMMPWAKQITDILHVSNSEDILQYVSNRENTDSMEGFAVPGIINDVGNGYFMSYMTILALYSKDRQIHLYNIALYVLFLITLFFIQERSAFVAGGVLSVYAIFRILMMRGSGHAKKRIIVSFILIVGAVILLPKAYDYMMSSSTRYITAGFDYASDRSSLNDKSMEFLSNNPMGGFFDFYLQYHAYPHNLFFNALIYGGLIGGMCIFILLWKQVSLVFPTITRRISPYSYELFLFSLMFIAYNLCSITHNQSVVTGDPTFWVLWGLCLTLYKKDLHNYEKNQKNH